MDWIREFQARPTRRSLSTLVKMAIVHGLKTEITQHDQDIAASRTQAVVNAANSRSFTNGDTGVSGALRDANGGTHESDRYSADLSRIESTTSTGGASVQIARGKLSRNGVRYIIHGVGPNFSEHKDTGLLASAITNSLDLCHTLGCTSVSIPFLSTGVYLGNKNLKDILELNSKTVRQWVEDNPHTWIRTIDMVRLVVPSSFQIGL